jgi:sialic acid synthase SpsE
MTSVGFDGHEIGEDHPAFIIAEIGSNHNGKLGTAKQLIDVAAGAGVDAVKFQTFTAENLYVPNSGVDEEVDASRPIFEVIKDLEHPKSWIRELSEYAMNKNVIFLSTPFDEEAVERLNPYVPGFKIASASVSYEPLLSKIGQTGKPVILSTGAHDMNEIKEAVSTLEVSGASDIVLLHCIAAYPTPEENMNLNALRTLQREFPHPVGLSDHSESSRMVPCAAIGAGASVLEKHITLDKDSPGPDHRFALEPDELGRYVDTIRRAEGIMGDSRVIVHDIESKSYDIARRGVFTTSKIRKGELITRENTKILRPGTNLRGIAPKYYEDILDATAARPIDEHSPVTWEHISEGQHE